MKTTLEILNKYGYTTPEIKEKLQEVMKDYAREAMQEVYDATVSNDLITQEGLEQMQNNLK